MRITKELTEIHPETPKPETRLASRNSREGEAPAYIGLKTLSREKRYPREGWTTHSHEEAKEKNCAKERRHYRAMEEEQARDEQVLRNQLKTRAS